MDVWCGSEGNTTLSGTNGVFPGDSGALCAGHRRFRVSSAKIVGPPITSRRTLGTSPTKLAPRPTVLDHPFTSEGGGGVAKCGPGISKCHFGTYRVLFVTWIGASILCSNCHCNAPPGAESVFQHVSVMVMVLAVLCRRFTIPFGRSGAPPADQPLFQNLYFYCGPHFCGFFLSEAGRYFFSKDCRPSFQTTPLTESRPQRAPLCLLYSSLLRPIKAHTFLFLQRVCTQNVIFYLEASTSILIFQDKFPIFVGFFPALRYGCKRRGSQNPNPPALPVGAVRHACGCTLQEIPLPMGRATRTPKWAWKESSGLGLLWAGAGGGGGFRCSEFICDRGSQQTGQMHYRRLVQRREQIKTTIAEEKSWNV